MANIFTMFKTMMWKNWIVRKRHWFVTLTEIVLPCLIFGFMLYVHMRVGNHDSVPEAEHTPTEFDTKKCFNNLHQDFHVLYAPSNKFTNKIMNQIKEKLWPKKLEDNNNHKYFSQDHFIDMIPMRSEIEIENYYNSASRNETGMLFYGIVFDTSDPKTFKYTIRIGGLFGLFSTDKNFPEYIASGRGIAGDMYTQQSCFVSIQEALDIAYIEDKSESKLGYNIHLFDFPYPQSQTSIFDFLQIFVPICFIACFGIILPNIIKRVVEEKQSGVKELMKMMGLKSWMVWVGWLLNANMINIFITVIITVILSFSFQADVKPIIPYVNPFFLWLLLFLFMNASTIYLFVVCAIFNKPLIAASVGLLVYLVPPFFLNEDTFRTTFSLFVKLLTCIIPPVAVKEGTTVIFSYSSRGSGITFNNLFKSATDDKNDLSLGLVFVMLLFDICLYAVLTWYIDNVRPGPYGRAKPWYFIFTIFQKGNQESLLIDEDDDNDTTYFEQVPRDLDVGLSVRNLTKVFPPNVNAVNGVNIDIYKGQITALLGHNGAGKTTTMSILTGLFSPTSGTVHQHETQSRYFNIFENMDKFRQDLGLCPQHNMLFPYFTVIEHLLFFGMLKGLTLKTARKNGLHLLNSLNMSEKANVKVDQLSGGMKRKLSLAVSLISEPKVLMLDEPTSGMDPESRREMWDILLNLREGRTIIITTHLMEEADVLGDRIAIMDHGKVRCYGTSIYLKKAYGAGYGMTLLIKPEANEKVITEIVLKAVAGSKLRSVHKGQLVYNLPSESSAQFPELFSEIENKKSELHILSIGVSCTTMEEVFLKVGELSQIQRNKEADEISRKSSENVSNRTSSTEHLSPKKLQGLALIRQQFCALLKIKLLYFFRKKWSYVYYTVLAVLMVMLAFRSGSTEQLSPPLKLDLDLYKDSHVLTTYTADAKDKVDIYQSIIDKIGCDFKSTQNGNLTSELLKVADRNLEQYRLKYVVASDWANKDVNGYYSNIPNHAPPITLNLITNTLLKLLLKDNDQSIDVSNHPFSNEDLNPCTGNTIGTYFVQFAWIACVPFGLLFLVANFIPFPLLERVSKSKHLQLMTGLSPITYWISGFIWDILLFVLMSFLLLIPVAFFDRVNMFGAREIGVFLLIVNLYGFSGIVFAYFFSFLRSTPAGAESAFIFYNTIFGVTAVVAISILTALELLQGFVISAISGILLLNPYYCVSVSLSHFVGKAYQNAMCNLCNDPMLKAFNHCEEKQALPYTGFHSSSNPDGIGLYLTFLVVDFVLYFLLIFLIDYGIVGKYFNYLKKGFSKKSGEGSLDSDVLEERDRVDAARSQGAAVAPVLIADNLKKKYGLNFHAVKGISFAVSSGECFGLLGVNGAGKTTTFRMLTGDEIPTSGKASIGKYSLTDDRFKYLKQVGYCPQFDALNEILTGQETLNLYGLLRGLNKEESQNQTDYWINFLGIQEYSKRLCGTYSGGNKRKLSTAIALIGDPAIVFLDEPTSGVDPVARRKLWDVLARCQKGGQSIVLTSHSMDECEALCNRLTIMVRGQMVCIGNIQYLKQKFGQGFTIMVKLHSVEHSQDVVNLLKKNIGLAFDPNCDLKDEHKGLLHYHVTDTSKTWSSLFRQMNEIKKSNPIVEDYVISETTLEQVFISFARQK